MYISGIKNRITTIFLLFYYKICYGKNIEIRKNTHFRKDFIVTIRENGKVKIGENCFFNNYCSINSLNNIVIGNDCIFGENVKIYDHNHKFNKSNLIREQGFSTEKITIGNNCWIGSNVTILKGAKIGNNVVIGSGCTINEDIADNSLVRSTTNIKIEKIVRGEK